EGQGRGVARLPHDAQRRARPREPDRDEVPHEPRTARGRRRVHLRIRRAMTGHVPQALASRSLASTRRRACRPRGGAGTLAAAVASPTPAQGARRRRLVGEAKWWLKDAAGAREALSSPDLREDPFAQDLLARACYELKDFACAAQAWEAAKNPRARALALWR